MTQEANNRVFLSYAHDNLEMVRKVYDGLIPLYDTDIAEAVLFIVTRPPHVNINDMVIMPTAQASAVKSIRR